ncbi:hypothetical protein ACS0TY_013576 [Phlomoides rotata]
MVKLGNSLPPQLNKKKDGGSGSAEVRAIRIIRGSDELQADVKLRGYSGWNTRMALKVLDQVFPKGAAVQPSLVIVNFGGDDATNPHPSGLGAHVPLLEYIENTRKIIMHLKSLSDRTRIICLSSPPINEAKVCEIFGNMFDDQARTNENCRIYSEALVKLCQEMNVEAINLWTAIREKDDWANAYLP